MKKIRSFMTMAGLSLVVLTLGVAGANAQNLSRTLFHGSINLPAQTQWGSTTLPAGQYNVFYGPLYEGGVNVVEIISKERKGPQTFVLSKGQEPTSAQKNSLICVHNGKSLVVRQLEMATIGQSVDFTMPRHMELTARKQTHGKYTAANEQTQVERISVNMDGR